MGPSLSQNFIWISLHICHHWRELQSSFSSPSTPPPPPPSHRCCCSNPQSLLCIFSAPLALQSKCSRQNRDWTQHSATCSSLSVHVTNTSTNGHDGEEHGGPMRRGREPLGFSSCKPWLQICRSLHTIPKCWQDEEAVFSNTYFMTFQQTGFFFFKKGICEEMPGALTCPKRLCCWKALLRLRGSLFKTSVKNYHHCVEYCSHN